jgi:hypothetical protein
MCGHDENLFGHKPDSTFEASGAQAREPLIGA